MTTERTSATIDPIQYSASYKLAAEEIRRAIELGVYLPGDRLPPTRQLSQQLGISVATLREAVRGLIDQGILEMRRGPKGGLVVLEAAVKGGKKGKVRRELLREIEATLEFRRAVEPYAAQLAAERRSQTDLDALEKAYDEMTAAMDGEDGAMRAARFNRADSTFHGAIATASGNPYLAEAIEEARTRMFRGAAAGLLGPLSKRAGAEHDAILREIRRGRPGAAAKAMLRHLEATGTDFREMRSGRFPSSD
ncbi:MAG TPA: FCD domain-containing protein [Solirubrobacterales bacterium]|nr:FCD domain-containing protein [Solirubrobacterales bacterium]